MLDLRDLYQEIIVEHNRHPRNFGKVDRANRVAEGYNPLCGDKLTLYIRLEDGVIVDAGFEGSGCAISIAAASLMTEHLKGKSEQEAKALFGDFHDLVTREDEPDNLERMGKLGALAGVRHYPARVKCATLCWHTLNSALADNRGTVATE